MNSLSSNFQSKNDLVSAAKEWAVLNFFYLSVSSSTNERVVLICIRGGSHRDRGNSVRTIKCECPFRMNGRKQSDGQWKLILNSNIHNHSKIEPSSVPQGRTLSLEQKNEVIRLHDSTVEPRQIM
jgi:hypothetical protein